MPFVAPADAIAVPFGELTLYLGRDEAVIAGPGADPGVHEIPADAAAIRDHVRCDGEGRYRPLSGLRNLPRDWHARFPTIEALAGAVDTVYPLGQRHATLHAEGCLRITPLDETFARQEGRYAIARDTSPRGRALAVSGLCGACVRVPLWADAAPVEPGAIPCPEACSVMLSLCREVALWEADRPGLAPPDPEVSFAAFDEPGNPLREAILRALEPIHE